MVRIYSTSNCTRITEVRRGLDEADVFSIAISPSNTLFAVTSDKSTLHVFPVPKTESKWGFLSKVPMLPGFFSDIYSSATAHFEIGNEQSSESAYNPPPLGNSLGKPSKGNIGWLDDKTILVIGSGRDGRWEKFVLHEGDDGRLYCNRTGWKRYLGGG